MARSSDLRIVEAEIILEELRGGGPAVWCTCGTIILAEVGDGFVVTVGLEHRWMRRRFDTFVCPSCKRHYALTDLRALSTAGSA